MARRALLQIVDPSPDKHQVSLIWDFFESRCAYCEKELTRGAKEGHIDHLVSASASGRNHMANRVLACATCNEKEKRDADWNEFLSRKCPDPAMRERRAGRISAWLTLQKANGDWVDPALILAAEEAAAKVAAFFNERAKELKARLPKKAARIRLTSAEHPLKLDRAGDPTVKVRYAASRLTFKRDKIEPLTNEDPFQVDTPDGSFVMTKAELHAEFPGVVASDSYSKGAYSYSTTPARAFRYIVPASPTISLDQVLDALNQHRRRATYGAVAGTLGGIARTVTAGRPKDPRHSWIVNAATGLPTDYEEANIAPCLRDTPDPISDARALMAFLQSNG